MVKKEISSVQNWKEAFWETALCSVNSYLSAYNKPVSIEGGFESNDGSDLLIADILEDEKANVYANAEYENLKNDIEIVVSTLKEREQDVVKMRYGLDNFAKKTLEEIGNIYGVTKECIRQTELRALKKLRVNAADTLVSYLQ